MALEDAWRPIDDVAGTNVDTFVYMVERGDGLFCELRQADPLSHRPPTSPHGPLAQGGNGCAGCCQIRARSAGSLAATSSPSSRWHTGAHGTT